MNITFERGRKAKDDRIVLLETEGAEAVTIFKVGLLVNQLALNETRIHDHLNWEKHPFYFQKFVNDAATHGHQLIDWADPEHKSDMLEVLSRWEVDADRVDKELLGNAQTELGEWQDATPNPNQYPGGKL